MTIQSFPASRTQLGELEIRRALPLRERRMIGPWCFLDRYGPVTFDAGAPMDLPLHPHIGIQTVSWLLDGEVLHRDTLGSESMLRPGGLNLMTSARGIAHSETTPSQNSGRLNGVQLWIALPEASRHSAPAFETHRELPVTESRGGRIASILGEDSPATTFSPIVGAELSVWKNETLTMPLRREFEHALLVLDGTATLESETLVPDVLYSLGMQRDELSLSSRDGARLLLIGGVPFEEKILMWWNFVARTREEIAAATEDWETDRVCFGGR
ncbi:MAG TPA: pirin family protein [Thermoanaerobaculia bacterium]|nr:pirin family protein [Thermoanaerobaculia bacterium]